MNSVISAFKTKKNSNSNSSNSNSNSNSNTASSLQTVMTANNEHKQLNSNSLSLIGNSLGGAKKKSINSQDNGYQYLRHIREIDSATKLLSPVVMADELLETAEKLSFRPNNLAAQVGITLNPNVDVVDCVSSQRAHLARNLENVVGHGICNHLSTDFNMNGNDKSLEDDDTLYARLNSDNCHDTLVTNGQQSYVNSPIKHSIELDDDESEHSITACTSTTSSSSSSEHSNSTVVHSPATAIQLGNASHITPLMPLHQQQSEQFMAPASPTKSPNLSLSSNSCSSTTLSLLSSSSSTSTSSSSSSVSCPTYSSTALIGLCNSGPSSCSSTSSTCSSINSAIEDASLPSSPTLVIQTSSSLSKSLSPHKICSEYVPAFLKSSHVTLPIIMPNINSSLASLPCNNQGISSAASTPKHTRYGKPRLSLSRFINHSMPSVHGRPNLSLANGGMTQLVGNGMSATEDQTASGNYHHYNSSNNGTNQPKRSSTHQRNLSLDFRSMGILLPPVSQVTNTRINLTQHHRNRSLDSALQRIPEVEVSSPNAENENTFCTASLLGSTMCSKIVTTATNVTAALTTTETSARIAANSKSPLEIVAIEDNFNTTTNSTKSVNPTIATVSATATATSIITNERLAKTVHKCESLPLSNVLHDTSSPISHNTIVEPYCSMRVHSKRPISNENERMHNLNGPNDISINIKQAHTSSSSSVVVASTNSSYCADKSLVDTNITSPSTVAINVNINNSNSHNNSNNTNNNNNNKKREDLTSLGSDDSGIICGSDSDQISLNRIRHSHESLDSGEMDAEEECIDMLETNSMDEEYNMLQSDLCFYQSPETDCHTLRPIRKKHQNNNNSSNTNNNNNNTVCVDANSNNMAGTSEDCKHVAVNQKVMKKLTSDAKAAGDFDTLKNENTLRSNIDRDIITTELNALTTAATTTATTTAVLETTPAASPTITVASVTTTHNTIAASSGAISSSNMKTPKTPDGGSSTTPTPIETPKNEVLFRNFFGATKNVIFRTAQSIIENHEKKNAAKQNHKNVDDNFGSTSSNGGGNGTISAIVDQVKSPNDVSKKKEFFGLLTVKASKNVAVTTVATTISTINTTTTITNTSINTGEQHVSTICSPMVYLQDKEKELQNDNGEGAVTVQIPPTSTTAVCSTSILKSSSISSLQKLKVPGVVKCFIKERPNPNQDQTDNQQKTEKGPSGLLRFFESPVFNIHFAIHYLFYSKEPGVLSFIGNKIFSFADQEVDLYIPQLIIMYIQMDELAEVLDPYLTIRCRKSVDFSLKCLWLLEAYNYQHVYTASNRKNHLALMKEIFPKKERKQLGKSDTMELKGHISADAITPNTLSKKTHHRSQSDATVLLADSKHSNTNHLRISNRLCYQQVYNTQNLPTSTAKLCLGDLSSGRAFDNGCTCFATVRGQVNDLLGQKTVCSCNAPKTAPQKEFMKALINVGKNLTALSSKAEKTSALRMFLNLINKNLPARVWIPLYSDIPHHVVRITEEKTAVLNSKDKTPYIIYVEVVEVSDIYSSSLIPKLMPSLRHTKSEEHLECGIMTNMSCKHSLSHQQPHLGCSRTSSCSSHGSRLQCQRRVEKLVTESSSLEGVRMPSSNTSLAANPNTNCNCENSSTTAITTILAPPQLNEDDVWSQEDDEITAQYMHMRKMRNNFERDAISQMSLDSCDSRDPSLPALFNIGDVRTRHCNNLNCENAKSFSNDPEDPSAAALKEPWHEKELQIRESSPYGHLSNWRLLAAIVKCGDDLRQELMATQLLQMFKIIWQEENVALWVRPYKIVCLSNDSGLIEPILNTVSLHQIKKNSNKSLYDYFIDEYGPPNSDDFCLAQKNFVQSCAAYCLISYLLQVKDRHNGNILIHSDGHIIHIDFGFILNISPKNLGFEQSPFKLTPEFVDVMGGTDSEHWREFNHLLLVGMMTARKHMDRIINFVEIMRSNAQLPCFKNGCSGTVQNLRKRFHMNLTEQEMERKVEQLVQDSLKSLSTKLYDGYQYYTNGIL